MSEMHGLMTRLGADVKQLVSGALELSYFSRGAWSYNDVLEMSAGERELATEFINGRLEHAKKMPFPIF